THYTKQKRGSLYMPSMYRPVPLSMCIQTSAFRDASTAGFVLDQTSATAKDWQAGYVVKQSALTNILLRSDRPLQQTTTLQF
ncbi:hypothetical protein MAR_007599, partial [Mya arenaria]